MENINSGLHDDEDGQIEFPSGFRFHPNEIELIKLLLEKVLDCSFSALAVREVDLNKFPPWKLPWMAKTGEDQWYFFCLIVKKYPTSQRIDRATAAGYWKVTGKDKEIHENEALVGMKKTLVFYAGKSLKGIKTNWVLHEYRLAGIYSPCNLPDTAQNEWVICRVFLKTSGRKKVHISQLTSSNPFGIEPNHTLPPLIDSPPTETITTSIQEIPHVTCFSGSIGASHQSSPLGQSCPSINLVNMQYPEPISIQQSKSGMSVENNGPLVNKDMNEQTAQDERGLAADIFSPLDAYDWQPSFEDILWNFE